MSVLPPVITVDGPSGVGKGALCKLLSKRLHWHVLDSGAIYRALALEIFYKHININDLKKIIQLALGIKVVFNICNDQLNVFLNGQYVNKQIYTEIIGSLASKIAVFPEIRDILLGYQRNFRVFPGLIADGRDMGTVVFPDAILKVFLDATLLVRCKRRLYQLQGKGFDFDLDSMIYNLEERDKRDYTREIAPLVPALDSLVLNSTCSSIDEIACKVLKCFYKKIVVLNKYHCNI